MNNEVYSELNHLYALQQEKISQMNTMLQERPIAEHNNIVRSQSYRALHDVFYEATKCIVHLRREIDRWEKEPK